MKPIVYLVNPNSPSKSHVQEHSQRWMIFLSDFIQFIQVNPHQSSFFGSGSGSFGTAWAMMTCRLDSSVLR